MSGRLWKSLVFWLLLLPLVVVLLFPYAVMLSTALKPRDEIFAFPPGTTIAPSYSALSRDPRFPTIATTRKWVIGSSCAK